MSSFASFAGYFRERMFQVLLSSFPTSIAGVPKVSTGDSTEERHASLQLCLATEIQTLLSKVVNRVSTSDKESEV